MVIRVNQNQPISNVGFVESLTLCSTVHLAFAVIENCNFNKESLQKVLHSF